VERTQRSDLEEFWATVDPKATDIEDRLVGPVIDSAAIL
jgi:hypothetical protein